MTFVELVKLIRTRLPELLAAGVLIGGPTWAIAAQYYSDRLEEKDKRYDTQEELLRLCQAAKAQCKESINDKKPPPPPCPPVQATCNNLCASIASPTMQGGEVNYGIVEVNGLTCSSACEELKQRYSPKQP